MLPISSKQKLLSTIVTLLIPFSAYADGVDAETRMRELEKQLQVLSQELAAMQQQMANDKEEKVKEKGKSQGAPVYAAFKDGITFEDGSGNWKLQLNGRVQADYRTYDPDEWKNDTFSVRRARLGGTFTFLKDFALRIEGEYANDNTGAKGTTNMTYGHLDYLRWSGAKIRAGQFKPFFGLERSASSNFVDFTELSLAGNNGSIFTSTFDRGVMLFGDPLPWLNYSVYVVNGSGQNNDDVRDGKDIGGRLNANFASLAGITDTVLHAGFSASNGSIGFSTAAGNGISQVTEANGTQFFNVTGLGIDSTTDRSRWGVETALAYGPVKLQAEYIDANFEGRQGGATFDNDIKAWYADLNWLIAGESYADAYKGGAFGRVRPKHNFDDKDGWGAFELGLRYSKFDASDFEPMLTAATATTAFTSEADAWTAGAKWILNPNARILLNYVRTKFDAPIRVNRRLGDDEDAVVLRAQYDF